MYTQSWVTIQRPHNNYFNERMDKLVSDFRGFFRRGKELATQTASEKVTNMVGTFLPEDSDGLQVPAIQMVSEKVTNMVGTFLLRGGDGFQVPVTK